MSDTIAAISTGNVLAGIGILRLSGEARMNTPGTVGENWGWRMTAPAPEKIKEEIRNLNQKYQRGGNH